VGGASAYDADWWAFGVCLYMWLHHVNPFEAPTPMLSMQRICEGVLDFPEGERGTSPRHHNPHARSPAARRGSLLLYSLP